MSKISSEREAIRKEKKLRNTILNYTDPSFSDFFFLMTECQRLIN